ncbi:hypothetical protein D3C78_1705960 [compost metagenome]
MGCFIGFLMFGDDGWKTVKDNFLKESFNGKVVNVFHNKNNHNTKTLVLQDGYNYGLYQIKREFIRL